MITIRIADKRRYSETNMSFVFTSSGYGGKFFTIPKSQLINYEASEIRINENTVYQATDYFITNWIYQHIKEVLDTMSDSHYKLIKED